MRFKHRTVTRRETFGQQGEVRHENFNRLGHFARRRAFRHGRDGAVFLDEVCATGLVTIPGIPARRTRVLKACASTSEDMNRMFQYLPRHRPGLFFALPVPAKHWRQALIRVEQPGSAGDPLVGPQGPA